MDGQVAAIRDGLDAAGYTDVVILAYAAKFASAFYGPFREAVSSSLSGDRRTYQQDRATRGRRCARSNWTSTRAPTSSWSSPRWVISTSWRPRPTISPVPVAAYQVSGEYAMICAAAGNNWIDGRAAALESLTSIRRAGADIVLTYWAADAAGWLSRRGWLQMASANGSEHRAVVLRARRQLAVGAGGPGRGGVDGSDRDMERRRGVAGGPGDLSGDGVGVRGVAGEGGADPCLGRADRRRAAPGHRNHPGARNREGVSGGREHGGVRTSRWQKWQEARALGELAGVPRGRIGIGLKLTGGRTAQAWARRHRHLRAALTPLVQERVEPARPTIQTLTSTLTTTPGRAVIARYSGAGRTRAGLRRAGGRRGVLVACGQHGGRRTRRRRAADHRRRWSMTLSCCC